jgi:hypothetical protein
LGELAGLSGGAHELAISFKLKESEKKLASRRQKNALRCPGIL